MITNTLKEKISSMDPYNTTPLLQDGTPLIYDFDCTPLITDLNGTPMMNEFGTPLVQGNSNAMNYEEPLFNEEPLFGNSYPNPYESLTAGNKQSSNLESGMSFNNDLNNTMPLIDPILTPNMDYNSMQVQPLFSPHLAQPLNTPVDNSSYSPFIGMNYSNQYQQYFTPLLDSGNLINNPNQPFTPLIDNFTQLSSLLCSPFIDTTQSPLINQSLIANDMNYEPLFNDSINQEFPKPSNNTSNPLFGTNSIAKAISDLKQVLEEPLISITKNENGTKPLLKDNATALIEACNKIQQTKYTSPNYQPIQATTEKIENNLTACKLKKGVRSETKEVKKYPCQFPGCNLMFARLFNLKTHSNTHNPNRIKPYACDQCPRRFDRKHDLGRHKTKIHENKNKVFKCPRCEKHFIKREDLSSHLDFQCMPHHLC